MRREGFMVRKSCFILGIALGIFWWIGLSENQAATSLWFDAVAAVTAFGTAALLSEPEQNPSRSFPPALIGLGLAIVWITSLTGHQPAWASWINFAFAVAFLGVAVAALAQRQLVRVRHRGV
jgi:hypothetical protein